LPPVFGHKIRGFEYFPVQTGRKTGFVACERIPSILDAGYRFDFAKGNVFAVAADDSIVDIYSNYTGCSKQIKSFLFGPECREG
jgi:hypothetical protein